MREHEKLKLEIEYQGQNNQYHYWSVTAPRSMVIDDRCLKALQESLGYAVAGYGYEFVDRFSKADGVHYEWKHYATCE